MYFTDRGIEELVERRGEEQVTLEWLADQLQVFVDEHPDFETPVERFATWLARRDDGDDLVDTGEPDGTDELDRIHDVNGTDQADDDD